MAAGFCVCANCCLIIKTTMTHKELTVFLDTIDQYFVLSFESVSMSVSAQCRMTIYTEEKKNNRIFSSSSHLLVPSHHRTQKSPFKMTEKKANEENTQHTTHIKRFNTKFKLLKCELKVPDNELLSLSFSLLFVFLRRHVRLWSILLFICMQY